MIRNKKKNTYCRNDEFFPLIDGDPINLRCFSLKNNISTGVVVVLLMELSPRFVDVKQSRRRIFDARLNRSALRISSRTDRNFAILKNKNNF